MKKMFVLSPAAKPAGVYLKGESHVIDDCCNTDSSVAAGAGDRLYDGLFYSYPAGCCYHSRAGQGHSGTTSAVNRRFDETKDHNCDYTDRFGHRGVSLPGQELG